MSTSFEILGCSAKTSSRKNSSKETQRIGSAKRAIILLIGNLRWPFHKFTRAVQSHAISKVSYGWMARLPPQETSWKLWALVWCDVGRLCMCWLRLTSFCEPLSIWGQSTLGSLRCLLAACLVQDAQGWSSAMGGSTISGWLKRVGYTEMAEFCWSPSQHAAGLALAHVAGISQFQPS